MERWPFSGSVVVRAQRGSSIGHAAGIYVGPWSAKSLFVIDQEVYHTGALSGYLVRTIQSTKLEHSDAPSQARLSHSNAPRQQQNLTSLVETKPFSHTHDSRSLK